MKEEQKDQLYHEQAEDQGVDGVLFEQVIDWVVDKEEFVEGVEVFFAVLREDWIYE